MPTSRHLTIAAACTISCEQPAITTSQCGHVASIGVCLPRIGGNIATQIIFRNNFPASNFPGRVYAQTPLLLGAYTTPARVCLLVRGWSLGTRLLYCHKTFVTPLLKIACYSLVTNTASYTFIYIYVYVCLISYAHWITLHELSTHPIRSFPGVRASDSWS